MIASNGNGAFLTRYLERRVQCQLQRLFKGNLRMSRMSWFLVAVALLLAGACSAEPPVCHHLPGSATEIAATPRQDQNLEMLALELSNGVTATANVYDRLVRDVRAIRALEPKVREVRYFEPHDGKSLILSLDPDKQALYDLGLYREWNCLNRHYGLVATPGSPKTGSNPYVAVELKGRYNMRRLAQLYSTLPGVKYAEANTTITFGCKPLFLVTPEHEVWHYFVYPDDGWCTGKMGYYFIVRGNHAPAYVASWDFSNPNLPAWAQRYAVGTRERWAERARRESASANDVAP